MSLSLGGELTRAMPIAAERYAAPPDGITHKAIATCADDAVLFRERLMDSRYLCVAPYADEHECYGDLVKQELYGRTCRRVNLVRSV